MREAKAVKQVRAGAAAAAMTAAGVAAGRFAALRAARWPKGARWPAIPPRTQARAQRLARTPRWHVVTIYLPVDKVMPEGPEGRLPAPLADWGDVLDVQIRPAPGNRGTELAARLRDGEPSGLAGVAARLAGDDPRQALRSALRQAKQLLEAGKVRTA
jgi:hypothetical protein